MDLAEFLLARIAEDEANARDAENYFPDDGPFVRWDPARVLAECDAKRRIVEAVQYLAGLPEGMAMPDRESAMGLERAMQAMGAVYADHPDYDPLWRS